jgi:hypothetical protein
MPKATAEPDDRGSARRNVFELLARALPSFLRRQPKYEPPLKLPDIVMRAASPYESERADEQDSIRKLQKLAAVVVVERLAEALDSNPIAKALRDQHAKDHGCVAARFVVEENLPKRLCVGLFQPGAEYAALLRFSNAFGRPRHDKKLDGRGMAIKLLNTPGESLLTGEHRDRVGPNTHDFLLTNFPVFFVSTPQEYATFLSISGSPAYRKWPGFFIFFVLRPRRLFILAGTILNRIASPLQEPYHSLTPYGLGEGTVVRYKVVPVRPASGPTKTDRTKFSFLRDAMAESLKDGSAEFEFLIQVLKQPTTRLVEDPSRFWSRSETDTVRLARIFIQPQDFNSNSQRLLCEKLAFNAWNAIPEHRPLGGINRSRHAVYLAVSQTRHNLNLVRRPPLSKGASELP